MTPIELQISHTHSFKNDNRKINNWGLLVKLDDKFDLYSAQIIKSVTFKMTIQSVPYEDTYQKHIENSTISS